MEKLFHAVYTVKNEHNRTISLDMSRQIGWHNRLKVPLFLKMTPKSHLPLQLLLCDLMFRNQFLGCLLHTQVLWTCACEKSRINIPDL